MNTHKRCTMKKLCLLASFFYLFSFNSFAQYYEAGVMIGSSNYLGDISSEGLAPTEYNWSYGVFGRYNLSRYVAFKGSLTKATISGSDNNSRNSDLRDRNLSFKTSIVELAVTNEFHLTPLEIRAKKFSTPYVFAGISAFHFNPKAEMNGEWYNLQPLGTEGQGRLNRTLNKYKRWSVAIPFGFGIKINLTDKINIGFEAGARKTITDYLDDVSNRYPDIVAFESVDPIAAQLAYRTPELYDYPMENPQGDMRGNPNDQDWFFVGGVTVSINLTDRQGLEWDKKYKRFDGMTIEK